MRARSIATLVATVALLASVAVGVLVAVPGLAFALLTPHDDAAPVAMSTVRPHVVPTPAIVPTATTVPYSGPLLAARGSAQITRAQLHAWVLSRSTNDDNTRIWEAETWLDIRCMARKGFLDDPTNPNLQKRGLGDLDGLTDQQVTAYNTAMDGPPTDAPYDWRAAGCHGRSVHLMGQDHAN